MAKTASRAILQLIHRVLVDPRLRISPDQDLLQDRPGTVYEVRNETGHRRAVPMVNALRIDRNRSQFLLSSKTITNDPEKQFNVELVIPTDEARLNDASWHHLAFTYAARPLRGDSVRQAVTWKGDPGLKQLAGKTVRVKIELQDAKLYALQFVNRD